jgi:hypothetical protein
MKTPIYLVEKSTGLKDENGVELFYTVTAWLNRRTAQEVCDKYIENGTDARIRKLIAKK